MYIADSPQRIGSKRYIWKREWRWVWKYTLQDVVSSPLQNILFYYLVITLKVYFLQRYHGPPTFRIWWPDGLRWGWYNNNRDKVHNKCSGLKSYWNHSSSLVRGKIVFHKISPWCQKWLGTAKRILRFGNRMNVVPVTKRWEHTHIEYWGPNSAPFLDSAFREGS